METPLESAGLALEEVIDSLRRQLTDQQRRVRLLDTQLHVLERERQKLAALMHHADAGFVVFDTEKRVTWTNAQFVRGFGHDSHPTSFHGASCQQALCGKTTPCEACPLSRSLASGRTQHHEIDLDVNGQVRNLYISAIPIATMTGEIAEIMVMVQDLSDLDALKR